jgi:phosphomannomutase/phosphoglucomutase
VEFNPFIIREYDIRGEVRKDLSPDVVEGIGRAFGTHLKRSGGETALLGRDCRLSSPELSGILSSGIRSTGISVVDAGMIPTPCLYFGLHTLSVDGGVMITGSHNPPEYNGFKVAVGTEEGRGDWEETDLLRAYRARIREAMEIERPLKIVVDSGNGTGGLVAPDVFRDAGHQVVDLYSIPDGRFPNHHPDPTVPKNLEDLIRTVREENADLGVAFDGDADRIGAVDETGTIIWGDHLLILFAREILSRGPCSVVFEVKCSQALIDEIYRHGGNPIMSSTGHSLIKKKMKEEGATLAGEMSGHIFFADRYYGYDDAIYAAVRLIGICSRSEMPLSGMLADIPQYSSTPEIRVDCPDDRKFQLVDRIREHFRRDYEVIDVDGARIIFPGGWGLVRASNTQPVLVLRFEADREDRLNEIQREVFRVLEDVGGIDMPD